jgi:hypothetical protein
MTGHSEVDKGRDAPVSARRKRERSSDIQEQPQPAPQSKPENLGEDARKAARGVEDATRRGQTRPAEVDESKSMRPSETERESGYVRVTEEAKRRLSERPPDSEERKDERYFALKRGFLTAVEECKKSLAEERAKAAESYHAPEAQLQTESPRARDTEKEQKKEALKGPLPKDSR